MQIRCRTIQESFAIVSSSLDLAPKKEFSLNTWKPTEKGWKMNVDASWCNASGLGGIGRMFVTSLVL